jgi:hypothetical protein
MMGEKNYFHAMIAIGPYSAPTVLTAIIFFHSHILGGKAYSDSQLHPKYTFLRYEAVLLVWSLSAYREPFCLYGEAAKINRM